MKVMIECSDANDLTAIEAAAEEAVGKCDIIHFKQAEGLKQTGAAKSTREASRIMGNDAGEDAEVVRARIKRGGKKLGQVVPPPPTPPPSDEIQEKPQEEKRDGLGKFQEGTMPGPGRPTKYEQDRDALFNLKRWWRLAAKKDRRAFLTWIEEVGK